MTGVLLSNRDVPVAEAPSQDRSAHTDPVAVSIDRGVVLEIDEGVQVGSARVGSEELVVEVGAKREELALTSVPALAIATREASLRALPRRRVESRTFSLSVEGVLGRVDVALFEAPLYTAEMVKLLSGEVAGCGVGEVRGSPSLVCGSGATTTVSWQATPGLAVVVAANEIVATEGKEGDRSVGSRLEELTRSIAQGLVFGGSTR
jgi:hypothetical protein